MSDPDLQALLQDVFAARLNHNVSPHYILTSNSSLEHQREALKYCYGVSTITYDDTQHDYGLQMFQNLGAQAASTAPIDF